jgi:hypothetical protein
MRCAAKRRSAIHFFALYRPVGEIWTAAQAAGITESTLRRAKKELRLRSQLIDFTAAQRSTEPATAIIDAYGFSAQKALLSQLLELNLAVAARISAKEPVTAPGIPPAYPDPKTLISDDCIRPASPTFASKVLFTARE